MDTLDKVACNYFIFTEACIGAFPTAECISRARANGKYAPLGTDESLKHELNWVRKIKIKFYAQ